MATLEEAVLPGQRADGDCGSSARQDRLKWRHARAEVDGNAGGILPAHLNLASVKPGSTRGKIRNSGRVVGVIDAPGYTRGNRRVHLCCANRCPTRVPPPAVLFSRCGCPSSLRTEYPQRLCHQTDNLARLVQLELGGDAGLPLHLEAQASSSLQLEGGTARHDDGQRVVALLRDHYVERAQCVGTAKSVKNLRVQRLYVW